MKSLHFCAPQGDGNATKKQAAGVGQPAAKGAGKVQCRAAARWYTG